MHLLFGTRTKISNWQSGIYTPQLQIGSCWNILPSMCTQLIEPIGLLALNPRGYFARLPLFQNKTHSSPEILQYYVLQPARIVLSHDHSNKVSIPFAKTSWFQFSILVLATTDANELASALTRNHDHFISLLRNSRWPTSYKHVYCCLDSSTSDYFAHISNVYALWPWLSIMHLSRGIISGIDLK